MRSQLAQSVKTTAIPNASGNAICQRRGPFDFVQQVLGEDLTDAFAAGVGDAMRPEVIAEL